MATLGVKFGEVSTSLEAGKHIGEVSDVVEKLGKHGEPVFEITVKVGGATIRDYLYFTEKAAWKIKAVMNACGIPTPDDADIELEPEDLVDCKAQIEVAMGDVRSNGKQYMEIKRWDKVPERTPSKPTSKPTKPKADLIDDDDVPF